MKIHQLPNGNWIQMAGVSSINYYCQEEHPQHTVTITCQTAPQCCRFETENEATAYRDALANLVNEILTPNI